MENHFFLYLRANKRRGAHPDIDPFEVGINSKIGFKFNIGPLMHNTTSRYGGTDTDKTASFQDFPSPVATTGHAWRRERNVKRPDLSSR
jgi:hypothetical protein